MIRPLLALLAAAAFSTPAPAQAPPSLPVSVAADERGFTAAWDAPPGTAFVCVERRGAWPPLSDTPIGCYAPVPSVVMRSPRDLNMQLRPGHDALVSAYSDEGVVLGRARVEVGERVRVWWPWWERR